MITNIKINKISPHPDNPRKDLGDLSELAESIKANGILQNLTVVPQLAMRPGYCTSCSLYNGAVGKCKNDYDKSERPPCFKWNVRDDFVFTVIIGHRRLAAAKLAGLTEVPCVISDMDYKKQISTMLLENMQRSDLTIYEQAQGFQMMLDLGESINDISQNTGFSESTVRRRVKLLDLDKEKFRKSMERGATLMDYAELEKIKDIEIRNKVLEEIGTTNFKWKLQQALQKERDDKSRARIISELEKFATKVEDSSDLQRVESYYPSQALEITVPDDTEEYFYMVSSWGVTLYKKANATVNQEVETKNAKAEEQRRRRTALDEISKQAYQIRCNFVKEISNSSAKKHVNIIIEYLLRAMLSDEYYSSVDLEEIADFIGIEINEDEDEEDDCDCSFDKIADHVIAQPERHLLAAAYLMLDSPQEKYYNWSNQHDDNETLNAVYDFLEKLGYEMSEEERALRDGTHELYMRDDESLGDVN